MTDGGPSPRSCGCCCRGRGPGAGVVDRRVRGGCAPLAQYPALHTLSTALGCLCTLCVRVWRACVWEEILAGSRDAGAAALWARVQARELRAPGVVAGGRARALQQAHGTRAAAAGTRGQPSLLQSQAGGKGGGCGRVPHYLARGDYTPTAAPSRCTQALHVAAHHCCSCPPPLPHLERYSLVCVCRRCPWIL